MHGLRYRVDYEVIQRIIHMRAGRPLDAKWIAYAVSAPRGKRFVTNLEKLGFLVKTREMRTDPKRARGWDVGLAVDAMSLIEEFDVFYLASGDGDLVPLLEKLKKAGKRIEVITFKKSGAHLLCKLADHITFLGASEVFKDQQ
jgi:uncharacterized LabA/DUF88 family protein